MIGTPPCRTCGPVNGSDSGSCVRCGTYDGKDTIHLTGSGTHACVALTCVFA